MANKYNPRSYASSPYPTPGLEMSQQMDDGIMHDNNPSGPVGPSLASSNKKPRRVTGRPPEPAVDPQFSVLSRGVGRARGGMKPKSPSVGYHRAE